jgi:hypothetical protein
LKIEAGTGFLATYRVIIDALRLDASSIAHNRRAARHRPGTNAA